MRRTVKRVAVLGSGIMGSRIACHFANIGVEVLLLDIVPRDLTEKEKQAGLTLDHPKVRNRIVNDALTTALKSNPSPIYSKSFATRIETGNFEDDFSKISNCDWILEAVIERLDIKKQVFEKVEQYRSKGSLVSSNTSGIPINAMIADRSDDFKKHFCGTHFFNPPRYLKLLEVIPTKETAAEVIDFHMHYGNRFLGKTTVLCKDTPAFIANRVGVFSMMSLFHNVKKLGLTVTDIDKLTGPVLGRPKSATFRTSDVVGLDTLVRVAQGLEENCPNDEAKDLFKIPDFIQTMLDNNWLGSKTGQGFYKKVKENGKSEILALNLNTLEYEKQDKSKFATLETAKPIDDLGKRTKHLFLGKDKAGEFYQNIFLSLFSYVAHRIPEISDEIYKIDDALKAGFGWELGPFEAWDAIGHGTVLEHATKHKVSFPDWIKSLTAKGITEFYKVSGGKKQYLDHSSLDYKDIPGTEDRLSLSTISDDKIIWKNSGTTITDIGDGIINVAFHTKMNTIGGEVIAGLNKAIDLAEKSYKGVVISNEGQNFSAGANVGMIFMMAAEQEYDELDFAIRSFQKTMTRLRYSSIPVVAAPHQLTLGGGCELCLHVDKVIAHAETYMGLVEFGVGVIPGGGGTKEFALRTAQEFRDGDIKINTLRNRFLTIGQAKVSTSAEEAFELGYLRKGIDEVEVSRDHQLKRAKQAALQLFENGYTQPIKPKNIKVLGKEGLGIVYVGAHSMKSGKYISEHDQLISEKLGYVLCGGDLSEPQEVSEDYLLDLERKAFLELCSTRKTLERMQSLIKTGKILRN
ncbi:3-hydroxyacyl-CoA dehydrogenase/enoyl-CoA hydratase family protein [Luteibaculum oceani]|uniref:3-hydroxyacyl-CoA dehydrogenase/enoyl-CoA hydratase family protein n=1 Tax=Luteibaculum oceani TaxID=1294296 RepID=A0A5C6V4M8_9FLAO|nr:3-hydroxyacyl-CoA dehydrogenase/enoyl-CoA hydratase family protein [Luteibaculum oceani]TXC78455.1 3-hydroxyacyl-CoA dehydrogenase/enoyl-CoA hydratase family protein [Luteibaculum oceani]